MKYYQVRFIKNGQEQPKEYTFGFDGDLQAKTRVDLPFGRGIVVGETDEEELKRLDTARIKSIVKLTEEKNVEQGN